MDNFSLECFIATAETSSFTKAAERMNRTQPAITQQISNLEKKIGVVLFNRDKKVSLTKDGELFLSYALRIHALYQELLDRFKSPELDGEVRVGVPEDFATLFLADVLIDFSRIHPRVFLNVECDLTLNLMRRFKNGELDLVIVKMSSADEFPLGVEIWKEPLVWVCRHEALAHIHDNSAIPLVLSPEPCVYRSRAIAALESANIRWRVVYSSPSYAGTIAAVKANMGITALPLTMIPDQLQRVPEGQLPTLPDIHVSLLKRSEKNDAAINTLTQFIVNKLSSQVQARNQTTIP
ncbi:MAG: LysR family transcriptional regulator [Verrucomicrobia bacterium]|nr:LysR family transcriptional regulator [Verrucomicrobiota bacterium]